MWRIMFLSSSTVSCSSLRISQGIYKITQSLAAIVSCHSTWNDFIWRPMYRNACAAVNRSSGNELWRWPIATILMAIDWPERVLPWMSKCANPPIANVFDAAIHPNKKTRTQKQKKSWRLSFSFLKIHMISSNCVKLIFRVYLTNGNDSNTSIHVLKIARNLFKSSKSLQICKSFWQDAFPESIFVNLATAGL